MKHAVFHNRTSCSLMLSEGEGSHPSGVCVKHLVFHTKLEDASVFFDQYRTVKHQMFHKELENASLATIFWPDGATCVIS